MTLTVNVRWCDSHFESFAAEEVRPSPDLLWMRLSNGENRHIPLRAVRWYAIYPERHERTRGDRRDGDKERPSLATV